MKFRTEVEIQNSTEKIDIGDKVFSIGSCFASEIAQLLGKGQLQVLNNPFGTIFNPFSINSALQRLHDCDYYTEEDLIQYNDEVISLDHHSSFNSAYLHKTLDKINTNIEEANLFLQSTKWVIITYGTSFAYTFLPKEVRVGNCHKIPGKFFRKELLSHEELVTSIINSIENVNDICVPDVSILFTVSPVRHTKDGMMENMLSKAKLIASVHEAIVNYENCHYLPIYEIMMDDLRDYRFYKEDMIHPSTQAVDFIFEKFGNAYFSDETMDFVEENFKIHHALNHKSKDENNPKYIEFLEKINLKIQKQQSKVKHKIF